MLAPALVAEVRRLLAEGRLSYRKIAKLSGVSRGTIGAIATGRRPDYPPPRAGEEESLEPSGPPERCPECGGMVYMPCRLCSMRGATAAERIRPAIPDAEVEELPSLDLKQEHRQRYEQVRARLIRPPAGRTNRLSCWSRPRASWDAEKRP